MHSISPLAPIDVAGAISLSLNTMGTAVQRGNFRDVKEKAFGPRSLLAPFHYLAHRRYQFVVTNLSGILVQSDTSCWWTRLHLLYTYDPNSKPCVHKSKAIESSLTRADDLGRLFVIGEIVEGMAGVSFRHKFSTYQELCEISRRLMRMGKGLLRSRLIELEQVMHGLFPGSSFYLKAVCYLRSKVERHNVQVQFLNEWEYFLCTKTLNAAIVSLVRMGKLEGPVPTDVDVFVSMVCNYSFLNAIIDDANAGTSANANAGAGAGADMSVNGQDDIV